MADRANFLYPRSRYYGQVTPENLAFNVNLQDVAQKMSYISSFHTAGKLSSDEAYKQIKTLWKELKRTRKQLDIGNDLFQHDSEESASVGEQVVTPNTSRVLGEASRVE